MLQMPNTMPVMAFPFPKSNPFERLILFVEIMPVMSATRPQNGTPMKEMMVQLLADRLAEAAAERMHEQIRKEYWGYAKDEQLSIPEMLVEKFQGIRPAIGYPSLPDTSVNFVLDDILDMKQIGIRLTESGAMKPHASVSGLMFSHRRRKGIARGGHSPL